MKTVLFHGISWDTDGVKIATLPSEVTLEVPDDTNVALDGADFLSDKYGWCVNGFTFREIPKESI